MSELVVFVSDHPRAREAKLAYGLQWAGWRVVLLHRNNPTFAANTHCAEVQQYRNYEEALAMARRYTPVVYHVFSNWDFDVAEALIRHRPGKIVFDDYDVVAGMVKEKFAKAQAKGIAMERFCLENADGLCCRSLETNYAKRHMGYKYRKRIFFPDYCWNVSDPPSKQPVVDGWLNIASVGNLYVNQHHAIGHPTNYHVALALRLTQHKIKSSLYLAACWSPEVESYLEGVLAGNPHVSFGNVPYEALIYELQSKCHAGLICMLDLDLPGLASEPYRQIKRKYSVANRLFDFMDAAMLIIVHPGKKFQYWLANRYHVVLDFAAFAADPGEYRGQALDLLSKDLSRARKTLSVRHQIKRLIEFYGSI